jgi:BASS family bile acid:Na+ symporter
MPPPRASSSSAAGGAGDSSSPPPLQLGPLERRVAQLCRALTMAFPAWVLAAAYLGVTHPPLFTWVSNDGITLSLAACMLGMGLTLTFSEIAAVFTQRPQLLALGMVLQYTVLPVVGWAISQFWGLARPLAIGVALVSCMPGGTASNIIALIAKGDMVRSC